VPWWPQVLERVRDEAERRRAGVIFLGDFWTHRGNAFIFVPEYCRLVTASSDYPSSSSLSSQPDGHAVVVLAAGTLSVEVLNAVSEEFRRWTVPVVMIPGNHDQVMRGPLCAMIGGSVVLMKFGVAGAGYL
jgi:hypothetical protein